MYCNVSRIVQLANGGPGVWALFCLILKRVWASRTDFLPLPSCVAGEGICVPGGGGVPRWGGNLQGAYLGGILQGRGVPCRSSRQGLWVSVPETELQRPLQCGTVPATYRPHPPDPSPPPIPGPPHRQWPHLQLSRLGPLTRPRRPHPKDRWGTTTGPCGRAPGQTESGCARSLWGGPVPWTPRLYSTFLRAQQGLPRRDGCICPEDGWSSWGSPSGSGRGACGIREGNQNGCCESRDRPTLFRVPESATGSLAPGPCDVPACPAL